MLAHLREVAHVKRALLLVARDVADDYPTQAHLLVATMRQLTRSADKLLGDTTTMEPPPSG